MKVNILGTDYEIIIGNEEDYPRLRQVDGYTDTSIKKLVILDVGTIKDCDGNITVSYTHLTLPTKAEV